MKASQEFLEELARRLNKSLPKEVAEARLREMQSHLAEAITEDGEDAALKRFGSAAETARGIVRQARGFDSRSVASLSLTSGLVLALSLTVTTLWMDRSMTSISVLATVWVPFLAVLFFAARCYQTRRWLALPVAAWAALGLAIFFVLSTTYPARLDPLTVQSRIKDAHKMVAIWDRNQEEVDAWRLGKTPIDSAPYKWNFPTSMYIPGLPVAIPVSSPPVYDIDRFDHTQTSGIGSWDLYGEAWAKTVAERRKSAYEFLASAEKGLASPPRPIREKIGFWLVASAELVCVLFAFNIFALLLGRLSDPRPNRLRTPRHPLTP